MTWAAGDRPCIEMGSRRTHEEAAVAAARAAYVAGFATTSNLAARHAVRHPDRRHQRAQLHAAARHRARRVHRPGRARSARAPRCSSTPTTWPRRCGTAVEVAGPDLGAVRLDSGDLGVLADQVRAAARRPRRDGRRGSSSPPTSTSTPSPRSRRPRSTGTASAPRWSPAAATRPAGSSTSSWLARVTGRRDGRRGRRRARTRSRSAAASTPCAVATPPASPRPRWSASASRRSTTATTGPLMVPLVRGGRGGRPREPRHHPRAALRVPRRAADSRHDSCPEAKPSSRPSTSGAEPWPCSAATSSPRCSSSAPSMTVRAAPADARSPDRPPLRQDPGAGPAGAVPAARAVRRQHRLAALHLASSGTPRSTASPS